MIIAESISSSEPLEHSFGAFIPESLKKRLRMRAEKIKKMIFKKPRKEEIRYIPERTPAFQLYKLLFKNIPEIPVEIPTKNVYIIRSYRQTWKNYIKELHKHAQNYILKNKDITGFKNFLEKEKAKHFKEIEKLKRLISEAEAKGEDTFRYKLLIVTYNGYLKIIEIVEKNLAINEDRIKALIGLPKAVDMHIPPKPPKITISYPPSEKAKPILTTPAPEKAEVISTAAKATILEKLKTPEGLILATLAGFILYNFLKK